MSSPKTAYILFGGPEMPCKLRHAFVFARDIAERGGQARIVFEGSSPKWLLELAASDHKLAPICSKVKGAGLIASVCRVCALVHGAVEAAKALVLPLLSDAYGHVRLAPFVEQGYQIITF